MVFNGKTLTEAEFAKLSLPEMLYCLPVRVINMTMMGREVAFTFKTRMPRLALKDGTGLSVQVGDGLYCEPPNNVGPYTSVEVGYPSFQPPEYWADYAENWETPTDTVYARVPIVDVMFAIAAHGGIDIETTFADFTFEKAL